MKLPPGASAWTTVPGFTFAKVFAPGGRTREKGAIWWRPLSARSLRPLFAVLVCAAGCRFEPRAAKVDAELAVTPTAGPTGDAGSRPVIDGVVNGQDGSAEVDSGANDGPSAAMTAIPDPALSCSSGTHLCGTRCVDNRLPENCGVSCEPCAGIQGGIATCDGMKCDVSCGPGQKPCKDRCVAENATCDGPCPSGTNACGGICVAANSLSSCGSSCSPCPSSPNGKATCDGDKCDLTCNPGFHRCGDACLTDTSPVSCGLSCSPCPVPGGGKATCSEGRCGAECPDGTRPCQGACVASNEACDDMCLAGLRNCDGNCVPQNDVNFCASCMPCQPPANAVATCANGKCDFTCRSGYHRCGNGCRDNRSIDSCGDRCERCPTPANATPSCNGSDCSFTCIPSTHECDGLCIPRTQACTGACPPGLKVCGQSCIEMSACCGGCTAPCTACQGGSCVQTGRSCPGGGCVAFTQCCLSCGACLRCSANGTACENNNGAACTAGAQAGTCNGGRCFPQCVSTECTEGVNECQTGRKDCSAGGRCVLTGNRPQNTPCDFNRGTCNGGGTCQRRCGPADGVCPPGCASDSGDEDCKLETGAVCGRDTQCRSTFCRDGRCCQNACAGPCRSCASPSGQCQLIRAGADPDQECAADAPATCGNDGFCDGMGGCRSYGASTVCSPAACSSDGRVALFESRCNGSRICPRQTATPCGVGEQCQNARCESVCIGGGRCTPQANQCQTGTFRCDSSGNRTCDPMGNKEDSVTPCNGGACCGGTCAPLERPVSEICSTDAEEACRANGADDCIVVRGLECNRQVCLWRDREPASCPAPGIWTPACDAFTAVNPGSVSPGRSGECLRTVAGLAPVSGCAP
jgi:hypothetical protein